MFKLFTKRNRFFFGIRNTYLHTPGETNDQHITLLPGVGIGPEITSSIQKIFQTAKVPLNFDILQNFDFSNQTHQKQLKKNKFLLLGNTGGLKSPSLEHLEFYKFLNLYARVVHIFNLPNVPTRHKNVDIIIIRENIEGEFSGVEHEVVPGVFESIKIITKHNSLRIAEYAFEHAKLTGRKKVTAVHKANIMKIVDGIFLEATREISQKYPQIQYNEIIIDNCAMQMVSRPQQFDVMVMPNLYGSIVSSIGAGLIGGAGVCGGASVGKDFLLFDQASRNSGTDIAGKNLANPTALILASINLLKSAKLPRYGDLILTALWNIYEENKELTKDVGGNANCSQFTQRVCEEIEKLDKGDFI